MPDSWARWLVRRGLTVPAIMFLESIKPLGFVAGQFLRCAAPFFSLFVAPERLAALSAQLEERDGIERFVQRIEQSHAAAEKERHERA